MTATTWALLAGSLAVGCEYAYRTISGPWWHYLWMWVPLQTFIGYCVYRLVTTPGTTLLDAFIVWTFATVALRICVSVVLLGDVVSRGAWAALAMVVAARVVQTMWR